MQMKFKYEFLQTEIEKWKIHCRKEINKFKSSVELLRKWVGDKDLVIS